MKALSKKILPLAVLGIFLIGCQGRFAGTSISCPEGSVPGELRWTATIGSNVMGSPAIHDKTVYIAGVDGPYFALDEKTGAVIWEKELTGFGSETSPAVGSDGTLYFNTIGNGDSTKIDGFRTSTMKGTIALNNDGTVKWVNDVSSARKNGADGSPALSPDGSTVVSSDVYNLKLAERGVAINDAYTYAFDAETGAMKWKLLNKGWGFSSPAITDDTVYYGTEDSTGEKGSNGLYSGTLRAVDLVTGELKWEFASDGALNRGPALFTDSTTGELRIAAGGSAGDIYIFDEEGTLLAKKNFNASGFGNIVIGDYLYVSLSAPVSRDGTNAFQLLALNLSDLSTVWTYSFDNASLTPALGNKGLYGVDKNGLFFALDPQTGEELWTTQTGPVEYGLIVLGKDGGAYVGSSDGKLYKVQTESCGGYSTSAAWPSYRGATLEATGQAKL